MGVMIGIIRDLEKLLNREGLKQNLSGTSDLSRILSEEEIWELILSSGYLTIQEKIDEDKSELADLSRCSGYFESRQTLCGRGGYGISIETRNLKFGFEAV